jgi:phenylacetic acid degradation operon negative regulatory protein
MIRHRAAAEHDHRIRPRALVFDLYGEYFQHTGGGVKLGALTELMGVFGVEAGTVRVVMTRLRKDGWFDSTKSGRAVTYLLNERSTRLLQQGHTRIFERESGDWNRSWTQAIVDASTEDPQRRIRVERALAWWGFGQHRGGVWFSPHDREKQVREMLAGEEEDLVFLRGHTAGVSNDLRIAERCWDLDELAEDYRAFVKKVRPRLPKYQRGLNGNTALVESVGLLHRYRQFPFRDPDLPEVLLPRNWPGRLAHRLFIQSHDCLRDNADTFVKSIVGEAG